MTDNHQPLRVAIIGTAKRSDYLYGPILRALPQRGRAGGRVGAQRRVGAAAGRKPGRAVVHRHRQTDARTGAGDRHRFGCLQRQRGGGLDGGRSGAARAAGDAHRPQAERGRRHHRRRPRSAAQDRGRRTVSPPPAGADQAGVDSQRSLWPRTYLLQRLCRARLSRRQRDAQLSGLRRAPRLRSPAPCATIRWRRSGRGWPARAASAPRRRSTA
jgi:hypothetical protein